MKFCFSFLLLVLCLPLAAQGAAPANAFRVALVLDKGGKDDKSFNSAAYAGALKAKKDLGVYVKYVETMDDAAVETTLRAFARRKFDIIIAVGFSMADAVKKIAPKYPEAHFALVDSKVEAPNVISMVFDEHQGSYLVGAIAALASSHDKIGFLGGMDVPLIRRFQMGFEAGARKIKPKITIVNNYVGVTSDSWNNPAKAKEIALNQFNQGVDVVFAAAGASNYGLFDAAEDTGKFAIGVDSNQNWVKPGRVLTSMLKRVDVAVFETVKEALAGKFVGGIRTFGLANLGVGYSYDEFNQKILTPEIREKADALKAEIISGSIKVPDYYAK